MIKYSLKFTQMSKYAHSLVSDFRDEMNRFMMGLSDDLQEECHSAMLHENMNIYRLMVHTQQVEESRAKRKSRMLRGQGHLMMLLQRVGLISKTSLSLRKGFLTKFHTISLTPVMIGCLTLSLRRERILVHQPRSQLVKSVARNIIMIV